MESLYHYLGRLDKAQAEFDQKFKEEEQAFEDEFNQAIEPLVQLVELYFYKRKVFSECMNKREFIAYVNDKISEVL